MDFHYFGNENQESNSNEVTDMVASQQETAIQKISQALNVQPSVVRTALTAMGLWWAKDFVWKNKGLALAAVVAYIYFYRPELVQKIQSQIPKA